MKWFVSYVYWGYWVAGPTFKHKVIDQHPLVWFKAWADRNKGNAYSPAIISWKELTPDEATLVEPDEE